MDSVFFSVIVPIYKTEKYLAKCIDSVLCQDFNDYELILINDGSPDGSLAIAEAYSVRYPDKIKLISQQNSGSGAVRNAGLKAAVGEYIIFIDSDDYVSPGMFSAVHKRLSETDADVCMIGINYVNEQYKSITLRSEFDTDRDIVYAQDVPYLFAQDSYIWDKICRRTVFTDNGIVFPDRAWYEDFCFILKVFLHINKLTYIKEYYYNYLQRNGSTMHNANVERNKDMLDMVRSIIDYYQAQGKFEQYRKMLEFMTAFHMLTLCTMRVAETDPDSHLLKDFRDYALSVFPSIPNEGFIPELMPAKYRLIYKLSLKRRFREINLIGKAKRILK